MTDSSSLTTQPTSQAVSTNKRLQIGKKLRLTIDLMVFEGQEMSKAARNANTSTRAIRKAFEKRHVLAYIRARREVLRASICAGNPRRLKQIRDQNANMAAAVRAVQVLEQLDDERQPTGSGQMQSPGFVIIVAGAQGQAIDSKVIDVTPTDADDKAE